MPVDAFAPRLEVLEQSGQISAGTRALVARVVVAVESTLAVSLDEGNAAMFVTHVATSLQRVEDGEPPPAVPDVVSAQAAALHDERAAIEGVLARLADAGAALPPEEIDLWSLHLAAIRETAP